MGLLVGGWNFNVHAEAVDQKQLKQSISGALNWLADHQISEGAEAGSWAAPQYRYAVTSLAGMAFLANGHLPGSEPYGDVVEQALEYVINGVAADGYIGRGDRSGMYIHAICSLFAVSYLGMGQEPEKEVELAEWCRKSLAVITESQKVRRPSIARGGWRYTPGSKEADVSVTSWQLLVLHAARQCGFAVDDAAIASGMRYINRAFMEVKDEDKADTSKKGGFVYRPGVSKEPEAGATGIALFVKNLLERHEDEKLRDSLAYLQQSPPSWGGAQYHGYFFFVSFYMSQGMFQSGDEIWQPYAAQLQAILLKHQAGDGHWPFPSDNTPQSQRTGPAFATAMATLILSLDKQYLPMYQRQRQLF